MTIVMFACSQKAYELMQELKQKWIKAHPEDRVTDMVKCKALPGRSEKRSLTELAGEWFDRADALIFFCAAGIAVRSIAPSLRHKSTDPAVLVLDETGKFCISLLSGHMGGANGLAEEVAELLKEKDTIPVITTATDREGRFSADDFARRNNLTVTDWDMAKEIAVRILKGEKIGFTSEAPFEGELPEELEAGKGQEAGILVSGKEMETMPYETTLRLVPRTLCVGIGCKKDTPFEKIESAVAQCFREKHLLQSGIESLSSIDLKKQEAGILEYCKRHKLPFLTYSARELLQVTGEFTASEFVSEITGVDNVCERSAALTAIQRTDREAWKEQKQQPYRLLVRKKCYDGVTLAVAERTGRLIF